MDIDVRNKKIIARAYEALVVEPDGAEVFHPAEFEVLQVNGVVDVVVGVELIASHRMRGDVFHASKDTLVRRF